jgi:hypothetical protein
MHRCRAIAPIDFEYHMPGTPNAAVA